MAALFEEKVHICTGSLISIYHILTTATCLESFFFYEIPEFDKYFALIGSSDLNTKERRYYYEQVEIHKYYSIRNSLNCDNNLGVITVGTY